ncbi:MAG TPA: TetR/AcrR family transcriptional regulator [Nonomuraea sp.]|uniref:TetR/AcrR family transcriptional regulator n=1 Tax=Nonomuraea sp. NPDC049649 TaxID=3155776 RepID=UPI002BDA46DB|nr:TetR/AcrR family transcriptional regulator [Nonomuraea sp.]
MTAALLRITEREGLEAVSVRTVAAEAGCSAGAVQRYFSTKDEMLHFALRTVVEQERERIRHIRLGPDGLPFRDALRAAILELLPLDEHRLGEARIWAAFYARAAVSPEFAAALDELNREARDNLRAAFSYAESTGELRPGQDHDALAQLLVAIMDGLMWSILMHPSGAQKDHLAAVDAAVNLITG